MGPQSAVSREVSVPVLPVPQIVLPVIIVFLYHTCFIFITLLCRHPISIVPIPSSNEEVRLVDDSFGKISHMVNDGSWMVRVQAAKTLVRQSMVQVGVRQ